ncbi:MAG: VOC family protein [Roseiarcus sp.]|jgi:catechol 2,3-dioxygenase-like lactoylglutathione lyase family enzyme
MFDHIGFSVEDFPASRAFYLAALAPLGFGVVAEFGEQVGMGADGRAQFWFGAGGQPPSGLHIAFAARSRAEVRAFHTAALAAGARDNGPPGLRPHYDPHYYGAFAIDLNGHNIEAVCRSPEA